MKLSAPGGSAGNALQLLSVVSKANLDSNALNAMWVSLKDAIHRIFEQKSSSMSFELLYNYGYKLCLHKRGDMLYSGVCDTIREHLVQIVESVRCLPEEGLLSGIKRTWDNFKVVATNIKDILLYMNRTHVKKLEKPDTFEVALNQFRDVVIYNENIRGRLKHILLTNVALERNGNIIDRHLMRSIVSVLVELGAYEDEFERDFLDQAKTFYMQESQQLLNECTCADYMRRVDLRLIEEANRATSYLSPSSHTKVLSAVEAQLITFHARKLVEMETSGCTAMFQDDRIDDLRRMYTLFYRVPNTLDVLRDFMGAYVKKAGLLIVSDSENLKDPVRFVQQMIDLRTKFDTIVNKSFSAEKQAIRTLKSAFEDFVNQDSRCASFLASFVDDLLKSSLKYVSESEAETHLDRFMVLFRILTDKDVFENYYKHLLAKRLLGGKSVSDELEKTMIAKLKAECGYQFTSKLVGMLTDMQLSKGVMEDFRVSDVYSTLPNKIDLEVHMLTAGFWPFKSNPACQLPVEIEACCEIFKSFYMQKYQGRKIVWITHNGTADIKANYRAGRKEFTVSTLQMCILVLFNGKSTLSMQELLNIVVPHDNLEFKRHLLSLCTPKMKILNKRSKGKGVLDDDVFTYNDEFISKFKHLKVPLISIKEVGGDSSPMAQEREGPRSGVSISVEQDRRHLVEASIVRIMKTRRTLQHNELIAEITHQLQNRFNPKPVFIKKCIESLIERDYLDRDKEDTRIYKYLA